MAHLTYQLLPVQARVLLRVATVPPPALTVGPGPPSILVVAPPALFPASPPSPSSAASSVLDELFLNEASHGDNPHPPR